MGKNLMIMLPFTRYLRILRAPKFTCGKWPRVIFGALRIVKNRVILVFTITTLPVYWLKFLLTRFSTAFYTPLFLCVYKSNTRQQSHVEQRERFAYFVPIVLQYHEVFRGVMSVRPAPDTSGRRFEKPDLR